MSIRSVLSSTLSLCLGLVMAAAVIAQTATPTMSNSPGQAVPGASAQNPSAPPPGAAGTQNGTTPQSGEAGSNQGGSTTVEDELQLTPDQKQKIAAMVDDENKQIAAVREDNSLSLQQKQQKALLIRQEGTAKIKAALTPEQLQKLAAIQQRMRDQKQGNAPQTRTAPQTTPQH